MTKSKTQMIALAVVMLSGSTGIVLAQQPPYPPPVFSYRPDGLYEYRSVAPSRWDRYRFDHSGTRGRRGLGADPERPEGPGNVSQ